MIWKKQPIEKQIVELNGNFNNLVKVRKKTVTVTTDGNGRFNPIEATGDNMAVLLGATATSGDWYHFRFYSGAGGTTRVIVTNYSNDTTLANITITVTLAYIM